MRCRAEVTNDLNSLLDTIQVRFITVMILSGRVARLELRTSVFLTTQVQ